VIYALVTFAGAFRILSGALSVGGLSVLLSYASQYMKPFNDISSVVTELQNSMACASRLFELIEAEPVSPEPGQSLPEAEGRVELKKVAFSYDKSKEFLKDLNITAEPGMRVAIVADRLRKNNAD
jgi:ATP-binding cassette subfamily B protein